MRSHGAHVGTFRCAEAIAQISLGITPAAESTLAVAVCGDEGGAYFLHDGALSRLVADAGSAGSAAPIRRRWIEVHLLSVAGRAILLSDACVVVADILRGDKGGSPLAPREPAVRPPTVAADGVWELPFVQRWACDGTFARVAASRVADLSFAAFGRHKCHVFLNEAVFARAVAPGEALAEAGAISASAAAECDGAVAFLPAIPVQVPQSQIVAAEWQQLSFTSVLLLIARRGDLTTALLYAVTPTGGFSATPTFQCLLSKAVVLPGCGLCGIIPIASSDPEHAPQKVRMFAFTSSDDCTLRTSTTRFSRFSAPVADRGYELKVSFPTEWGAPTSMRAFPVNRRRRTMLSPGTGSDVDLSSCVEMLVSFNSGPLAHVLFDPVQKAWSLEGLFAVRAAGRGACSSVTSPTLSLPSSSTVVACAAHPTLPLVAILHSDSTVSLHHRLLGCTLAVRTATCPSATASSSSDPRKQLDEYVATKCPEKARLLETLLKAVDGDIEKLLRQLQAKYGPLEQTAPDVAQNCVCRTTNRVAAPASIFFSDDEGLQRKSSPVAARSVATLVVAWKHVGEVQIVAARAIPVSINLQSELRRDGEQVRGLELDFDPLTVANEQTWVPALPSLHSVDIALAIDSAPSIGASTAVRCSSGSVVMVTFDSRNEQVTIGDVAASNNNASMVFAASHLSADHSTTAMPWRAIAVGRAGRDVALVATVSESASGAIAIRSVLAASGTEPTPMATLELANAPSAIAVGFNPTPCLALAFPDRVELHFPSTAAPLTWSRGVVATVVPPASHNVTDAQFIGARGLLVAFDVTSPVLLVPSQGSRSLQPPGAPAALQLSDPDWMCTSLSSAISSEGGDQESVGRCAVPVDNLSIVAATTSARLVLAPMTAAGGGSSRATTAAATASAAIGSYTWRAVTAHVDASDWGAIEATIESLSAAISKQEASPTAAEINAAQLFDTSATPLRGLTPEWGAAADNAAPVAPVVLEVPRCANEGIAATAPQLLTSSVSAADLRIDAAALNVVLSGLPSVSIAGLEATEQMRLLAALQVLRDDVIPATGGADRAALPLLFHWRLQQLFERLKLGATLASADVAEGVVPSAVLWALFSETQDKLAEVAISGAVTWDALRRAGFALWGKSVLLIRRTVEAVGRAEFAASRSPKACALYYVLAGKIAMLAALCKAVNNLRLEQFFSRDFSIDKNRSAASANAYAAMGKGDVLYAAAFFILAGEPLTAVQAVLQRERDWQLAWLIMRLAVGDTAAAASDFIKMADDASGVDLGSAARCCVLWRGGRLLDALRQLWACDDPSFCSIAAYAARNVPAVATQSRTALPNAVEASMLAAAARRYAARGIALGARRCVLRLRALLDETAPDGSPLLLNQSDAALSAASNVAAAPPKAAIAADFNSGQIMLRMDSDSDDDPPTSAAHGEAVTAPIEAPADAHDGVTRSVDSVAADTRAHAAQLALWDFETRQLLESDNLSRPASPKSATIALSARVESVAADALTAAAQARDSFAALTSAGCHTLALRAGRIAGAELASAYSGMVALAVDSGTTGPLPEQYWSLLAAATYHVLCTQAIVTQDVALASALLADAPPLADIVEVSVAPSHEALRSTYLGYQRKIASATSQAVSCTLQKWQAAEMESWTHHGEEQHHRSQQSIQAALRRRVWEAAAIRHLLSLFEAAASRVLRQAVLLRRLSSTSMASAQLILTAALGFERAVDALGSVCSGCVGQAQSVPDPVVNGVIVRERKEWRRLLRLLLSFPVSAASKSDAVPRFFYRLARVLCADVLHSTEQIPQAVATHGKMDRTAHAQLLAAAQGSAAAASLAQRVIPKAAQGADSTSNDAAAGPIIDELEHHHRLHVATNVGVRRVVIAGGAERGALLTETRELCPRLRATVHSCCVDHSTFDNVAIALGNSCQVFHGHRDALIADDDDALSRSLHERNHATSAFAGGTDPSVCCTVALEEHSARLLVSHPHLPIFLSGGSAGGLTLHQFGNPHATIRIRNNSHRGVLTDVAFSQNGYMYAATDNGGSVAVWRCASDATCATPVANLKCFSDARGLAFIGHRTTVLAAVGHSLRQVEARGDETSVKLIDALVARAVSDVRLPPTMDPRFCHFLNDEDSLLILGREGSALIFDTRGGRVRSKLTLGNGRERSKEGFVATCAALSWYAPYFAVGNALGDVAMWSVAEIVAAADGGVVQPLGLAPGVHGSRGAGRSIAPSAHSGTTSVGFTPSSVISTGATGLVVAMPLIPNALRSVQ